MPFVVRLFLGYALVILCLIGLSLRFVVDQAISAPVSPIGIVVMALLAYTIFTTTLVIQRKEAARGLAHRPRDPDGPGDPARLVHVREQPAGLVLAGILLVLAVVLLRGLSGPATRTWLDER